MRDMLALFLLVVNLLLEVSSSSSSSSILDYPYHVSVQAYGKYQCQGAIVDRKWIVTSAHCRRFPVDAMTVRAGSDSYAIGGSLHNVTKFQEHPHYTSGPLARYSDLALLRVEPSFRLDETRQPIELLEAGLSLDEDTEVVVTGWDSFYAFKAVRTRIMPLSDCLDVYHSRFGAQRPGIICVRNNGEHGTAACSEIYGPDDSGAPMVAANRLAGVFSWGYKCREPATEFPLVFMQIAYYRDWIKSVSGL